MRFLKTKLMTATAALAVMSFVPAMAASGTLKTTPVDNNYNNGANWNTGVPIFAGDTATFNNVVANGVTTSPIYSTVFTGDTTVGTFSFNAPNTTHIINLSDGWNLTFQGGNGVLVASGSTLPTFFVAAGSDLTFVNGTASSTSAAGLRATYSVAGDMIFQTGTNAGNADIQVGAATGNLTFNGNASASTALILNSNVIDFNGTSTASSSSITNNATLNFNTNSTAGSAAIANNDIVTFNDSATADASVITMGAGATVDFDDTSEGGTARIILNSSGAELVDLTGLTDAVFNIGSIEGGTSVDIVRIDDSTDTYIGGNNFTATGGVVTLNALIEGGETGEFRKVGNGELILGNNANTFSADVSVNAGKLTVGANQALGNLANDVTIDGGTLRTTTTFSSGRDFFLSNTGTFEVDEATSFTITSVIADGGETGTLVKTGAGALILTGLNTYSGNTSINAGTLSMGNGGATGVIIGNVAVSSGATFEINRSNAVTFAGNITGAGGFTQGGEGTTTLTGANTYSGPTQIVDGTLIASGGSAIGDASDVFLLGGDLTLAANETVGSINGGEGTDTLDLATFVLTLGGGSTDPASIDDDIIGTGSIVKNGSYTQVFEGDKSYTGDTTVNAGVLRVNGTLQGNVFVNQPGTFGGNATVFGNVTNNNGNVAPGNSPGVLSMLGDYIGVGAPTYTVDILAQSQGATNIAGTTHDLIQIGDDYVGASTQLLLNPTGTPVATVGNGIEIVNVSDISDANDFFLSTASQTAANGFYQGFQYVVNYVDGGGGQDRFFLQTQVREELVANATALAASRQLTRDCFRGSVSPAAGGKGGEGRGWLNAKVGSFNSDASNGADFDTNYNCVNGGFDVPVGSNVSVGIRGGYANSDLDLRVPQGLAQMDALTFNVEAAVTYISGAFYAGLSGGWTAHDWDYDHALASGNTSSESFDGFTSSLFAGYRAGMGKDTSLTLEGLVSYDGTDCDSNCFLVGTQEDISEWEGRLLGRIDTKIGGVMPYFQASVSSDFGDGQTVSFGNAVSNVDIASLLIGANVGVSANLGGNWMGVFDLGTTQGADSDVDGYHGSIGVKTTW